MLLLSLVEKITRKKADMCLVQMQCLIQMLSICWWWESVESVNICRVE